MYVKSLSKPHAFSTNIASVEAEWRIRHTIPETAPGRKYEGEGLKSQLLTTLRQKSKNTRPARTTHQVQGQLAQLVKPHPISKWKVSWDQHVQGPGSVPSTTEQKQSPPQQLVCISRKSKTGTVSPLSHTWPRLSCAKKSTHQGADTTHSEAQGWT